MSLSDGTFDTQAGARTDVVTYAPRTTAKVTKCDTEGATIELGEGRYTATWNDYLSYQTNTTMSSPSLGYYCTPNASTTRREESASPATRRARARGVSLRGVRGGGRDRRRSARRRRRLAVLRQARRPLRAHLQLSLIHI